MIPKRVGARPYYLFIKSHKKLGRRDAILAKCFECMGEYASGREDCQGTSCPLYSYYPYKEKK